MLAFLCWKEITRPDRRRLFLRLLASVLATGSLVYLLLPMYLPARPEESPEIAPPRTDTMPAGIQAAFWQRRINAGATLRVQGRFKNRAEMPVKLLLTGFNERLDSVVIPSGEQRPFELTARPRHIGRAVYTLAALAKDTLAKEPVPVEVLPVRPLKVLILAASPDFEHKFLANWLAEHNYIVAMRTAISRNKYSYTFLDTARFQLERITPGILTAFDLLISDAGALAAMGREELGAIRSQMAEKGLGLIVKADTVTASGSFYDRSFSLMPAADRNERPLLLHTAGAGPAVPLITAPASYLRPAPGMQALVWAPQQQILAGSSIYGAGRLVLTTINNSYRWILSGRQDAYQSLWALLLQQAARRQPSPGRWFTGAAFPQVRMPVPLHLEMAGTLPSLTVNAAPLSLEQDAMLPFRWQGTYWPVHAGWQAVVSQKGDSSWWYAFDEKDWSRLAAQDIRQYREKAAVPGANAGRAPQIWIAVIFMLSVIFLWAEEKFV